MLKYAERIEAIPGKPSIERQREGEARERYLRELEAQAIIDTFRHWQLDEVVERAAIRGVLEPLRNEGQ